MTKHIVYVNASIVAGIIAAMAISSTLLMTNSVLASLGESVGQKKDAFCANNWHTKNYCDGYALGKQDCEMGANYRGGEKSHTKDWRDGYKAGWKENGCSIP